MHPRTYDEVYAMLEAGQISVAQAFKFLRELEFRASPPVEERERVVATQTQVAPAQAVSLEDVMGELDALIGLSRIKRLVKELQAFIQIQKRRERERLATEPLVLHMIFKGKPLNTQVKHIRRQFNVGDLTISYYNFTDDLTDCILKHR